MNAHSQRSRCCLLVLIAGLLPVGDLCRSATSAGEAQLKNGTIVQGNMWLMSSLSSHPVGKDQLLAPKDADPVPRNIVLIDNGWQKYYVPNQQIPNQQFSNHTLLKPQAFTLKHQKTNQIQIVASVGSIRDVQPFDEFGRRRLTLETQKGPLQVIQGITQIEPDHAIVEGLNCKWKSGIALRAIPFQTLDGLLRKQIKADDPAGRLGLVGFYRQAEYYEQAFAELEAIARDFPDQQARCELARAELIDQWGREILRELGRRRTAGQHQLA